MRVKQLLSVLFLFPVSLFASPANSCVLSRSVLDGFKSSASPEKASDARRAINSFMGCDPTLLDEASRSIFFESIEAEFTADHSKEIEQWARTHPGSEAAWEAINIQQHELREYLDRAFDSHRDERFNSTVLRFGMAKTIERLGANAKKDLRKTIADGLHFYGQRGQYNSQVEAVGALGAWLDPADARLLTTEKADFAHLLTGLLDVSDEIRASHYSDLIKTALSSLSRSDDADALQATERWLAKRGGKSDDLTAAATATVAQMRKNVKKK